MYLGTRSAVKVLVVASAAQVAVAYVTFSLPAIAPALRQEFALSLAELGAVVSAILLGSGLALLPSGAAVDRFGSRRTMIGASTLATLGILGAAFAESKAQLLAFLFAAGLGAALIPLAGIRALFGAYPQERRGWALGVRQMAVPLGAMVAALLAPVLDAVGGVRLVLLVGAVSVALTSGAFAFVIGGIRGSTVHTGQPLRAIWCSPGIRRLFFVTCFYVVVLQAVLTYTVPATRAAGLSALAASLTYFAVTLAATVSRPLWGSRADRGGGTFRTRTLAEAGFVSACGAVLFALALHAGLSAIIPAAVVFGFGALGWNALVYVSAGERTNPELAGRSFAVAATVIFLVAAVSTPPLGALADAAGWDVFWLTMAAVAFTGALLSRTLPREHVTAPIKDTS